MIPTVADSSQPEHISILQQKSITHSKIQIIEAIGPPTEDWRPYWLYQQVGIRKIDAQITLSFLHKLEEQRKADIAKIEKSQINIFTSMKRINQQEKHSIDTVGNLLAESGHLYKFFSIHFPPLRDEMKQMFTSIITIQEDLDRLAEALPPTIQIPKFNTRTNYKQILKKEEEASSQSSGWSRIFQS